MKKPYNALDVACFIINEHNRLYPEKGITNLRLQKLLYFVQSAYLMNNSICFADEIEAWAYGPVVVDIYEKFKIYGRCHIPHIYSSIKYKDISHNNTLKFTVKGVIDLFEDYSDFELVDITCNQDPWINAIKDGSRTVVDINSIKEYFQKKARQK